MPWRKIMAFSFLGIPLVFISFFLIGEFAGGDWDSLGHFLQLLPLGLLLFLVWKKPRFGGAVLIVSGLVFGSLYFLSAHNQSLPTTLLVESVLFLPLLISGLFFIHKTP